MAESSHYAREERRERCWRNDVKIRRAYKVKLYPKPQIAEKMNRWFFLCCELYNAAILHRKNAYDRTGGLVYGGTERSYTEGSKKERGHTRLVPRHRYLTPKDGRVSVTYNQQAGELTELKQLYPELMEVNSHVLQDVLRRVDKAFQAFFRRCKAGVKAGFPRLKSSKFYSSFTIPNERYTIEGNWLNISRLGRIKFRCNREIEGVRKSLTVTREGILSPKWYASIISEIEVPDFKPITKPRSIGIDVGIESFVTLSDGTQIENPRTYRMLQDKLATAQRIKDGRTKGSNRRRKAAENVRKVHTKIREQRKNFQHHVTKDLVERFDAIAIENLNIRGMARNGKLAKHILDAGWGEFRYMLEYKAEAKGKTVIAVDPKRTSQLCSGCGKSVRKDLAERWHECPFCGLSLHRDHNAAINIQQRSNIEGDRK